MASRMASGNGPTIPAIAVLVSSTTDSSCRGSTNHELPYTPPHSQLPGLCGVPVREGSPNTGQPNAHFQPGMVTSKSPDFTVLSCATDDFDRIGAPPVRIPSRKRMKSGAVPLIPPPPEG